MTTENVQEIGPPIIAAVGSPAVPEVVLSERLDEPHPRLPQYTQDECQRAIEVIEILRRWRDEDRAKGLIDW